MPKTPAVARQPKRGDRPAYLHHPDFAGKEAKRQFDADPLILNPVDYDAKYMPDDVTRDHAKRMHYAAHRMHSTRDPAARRKWHGKYIALRDRIVLGNRKLIYKAVQRIMAYQNRADDLIGECHIVMIHAVVAYNPWIGVRFSTYAYTCLIRALGRLAQKHSRDWLARTVSFGTLPESDCLKAGDAPEPSGRLQIPIEEFFRHEHPLLTDREKAILSHRFNLRHAPAPPTLETVGATLGLSKERVRQLQATALDKLRKAMTDEYPTSA